MSSVSRALLILAVLAASQPPVAARTGQPRAAALRVCADPNNLPFSSDRRDGFENQIAALVAREMRRPLEYVWMPQRRGFIRNTLRANRCDAVIGVPAELEMLRTTRPYYRSTYVFVSRSDRRLRV